MKYILFFLLLPGTYLFGQTYQSSCTASGNMDVTYRHDIFNIALARLTYLQSPYKDSIDIPASYRDSISKALYAIENMPSTPLKDTIMSLFGFRNFNSIQQYEADSLHILYAIAQPTYISYKFAPVTVTINSGVNFYNDWISGNYNNTSNAQVNYLISRYGLQVKSNGNGVFNISNPYPINTFALAAKFRSIQGVQATPIFSSGSSNYVGDGNSIIITYDPDGIILKYRNGCGDCPAGCTYTTTWTFKVFSNTNCQVQYLGRTPIADGETAYQRVCSRGSILPLSTFVLKGVIKNNISSIEWQTASSENTLRYDIERSVDGVHFKEVGSVHAATSSSTLSWADNVPVLETVYYRVKSIHKTGDIAYSNIVKLSADKMTPGFIIYPNPSVDKTASLKMMNVKGNSTLSIFNMQGVKVYTKSITSNTPNTTTLQLPPYLARGVYQVVLQNATKKFKQVLLVQ